MFECTKFPMITGLLLAYLLRNHVDVQLQVSNSERKKRTALVSPCLGSHVIRTSFGCSFMASFVLFPTVFKTPEKCY